MWFGFTNLAYVQTENPNNILGTFLNDLKEVDDHDDTPENVIA